MGALCATRKNLESRTQLDKPVECASGGAPLFCIYCFSLWYEFFVHYVLERQKKLSISSWCGTFAISATPAEGELCHFGIIGKLQVSSIITIFLKKIFVCFGHCDNVLARCDSIFPLLRCQGVWNKTYTLLSFSFPDPLSKSKELQSGGCWKILLSFLMRYDSHFDQISDSSNVYLSSIRFSTATSLVNSYQIPFVLKSRITT